MIRLYPFLCFLLAGWNVHAQDPGGTREGKVSFLTTQSVYVRFASMESISDGDTLFIRQENKYVPALRVRNHSSISCVCTPLLAMEFKVADAVYARTGRRVGSPDPLPEQPGTDTVRAVEIPESDSLPGDGGNRDRMEQEISGRLSVSSYTNVSSAVSTPSQRMRYTFSMHADNLGSTRFSAESHISFIHSNANWEEIKDNPFNGLKIYNLSLTYAFNESMHISAGRKIHPNLSSVGAIDGIQFEKKFRFLSLGAVAGSRPDYVDYNVNPDLLQFGVYLGQEMRREKLGMQNSLAFIEQTNRRVTDRRFLYFQHTSWLMKNLSLFASAEMDLYRKVNERKENTFRVSNAYLSLRYRIIRQLTTGISYSTRQNIIYYETYKDFVERLLETGALQGWRLQIGSRPVKNLSLGVHAGYRSRKEDPHPSKHVYGYATYRQVPGIKASATLSATWLETGYLKGNVYSLGLSRELIPAKLDGGLKYRYVDYLFQNAESGLVQNVIEANLSWRVYGKLSLSAYYEGTFEKQLTHTRLYVNITQRF